MHQRSLGTSSVQVTPIMLGTWAIGGWMWGGTNEGQAIEAIQTSIDHGVTCIDTAAVYGFGLSEELVGKAIQGRRHQVTLASKCGLRWHKKKGSEEIAVVNDATPKSIFYECEESLKRMQVEVIDLFQIHWPDPQTPIEESWSAMVKLQEQGKVRAIGVSNFNLEQLQKAHAIHPVASLQSPYSLVRRDLDQEILPFCRKNKIAVLAYSPMERGLLSGKVTLQRQFNAGDHREGKPEFSQDNRKKILAALDKVRPIAEKYQATLPQVIIHCTYHMPGITAALVGARNAQQALENAEGARLQLSQEERECIIQLFGEVKLEG